MEKILFFQNSEWKQIAYCPNTLTIMSKQAIWWRAGSSLQSGNKCLRPGRGIAGVSQVILIIAQRYWKILWQLRFFLPFEKIIYPRNNEFFIENRRAYASGVL